MQKNEARTPNQHDYPLFPTLPRQPPSGTPYLICAKVYDPYFQHMGPKAGGNGNDTSGEGKLEQIRVKKLKFSLKGSNYEDAQNPWLSGKRSRNGQGNE